MKTNTCAMVLVVCLSSLSGCMYVPPGASYEQQYAAANYNNGVVAGAVAGFVTGVVVEVLVDAASDRHHSYRKEYVPRTHHQPRYVPPPPPRHYHHHHHSQGPTVYWSPPRTYYPNPPMR